MGVMSEALNPILALGKQARSYGGSVARSGIRTATRITQNALGHGMKYYAIGGAAVGGAIGGLDAYENNGSVLRGTLVGAGYGAAGGAALRLGMSAAGQSGRRALRAFGMRAMGGVGGGMSGAAAKAAGSTNYFRAMSGDFERAGGFGVMRGAGRLMYGRGRSAAMGAAGRVMNSGAGLSAASAAGRAVGAARGIGYQAAEYGRGAYNYARSRMGI